MINIMNMDCVEFMEGPLDNTLDLTVTSPPYDDLRSYEGSPWGREVWERVLASLYRCTAAGGVVVWIVGDSTIKGSETGASFKQALFAIECGFRLHDTMIWQKPFIVPRPGPRYESAFEYMFVFSKGKPKTINLIKDKQNIGFGRKITGHKRGQNGKPVKHHGVGKTVAGYGTRHNVWNIDTARGKNTHGHPAPFPMQLAEDHILTWSNHGDLVYDPFMGSGTTGIAAIKNGRRFTGTELVKTYYAKAKKRLFNTCELQVTNT